VWQTTVRARGRDRVRAPAAPGRIREASSMSDLNIGDLAPDFTLEGTEGSFTLSEHRGERVVLLFYPGDDTTVCTKQFCAYRDAGDEMADLGATFVGISTQGMTSKEAFKSKYGLTTQLLADTDGSVSKAYGVYTKRFNIAKRTVFIVDEHGKIAYRHGNRLSLTYDGVDDLKAALAQLPG
jgi:peroxiredoxin Q/BCP